MALQRYQHHSLGSFLLLFLFEGARPANTKAFLLTGSLQRGFLYFVKGYDLQLNSATYAAPLWLPISSDLRRWGT